MTGLSIVAVGTSLPDTFASRIAAISDDDADNAIGNITGSNAVNIFLGLGLPWVIATIYYRVKVGPCMTHDLAMTDTMHCRSAVMECRSNCSVAPYVLTFKINDTQLCRRTVDGSCSTPAIS